MADRVVKVRYEAVVEGAVANIKRLGAATADYADRGAEKVRKNEAAYRSLSTGLGVAGVAAGAALGVVTKAWMGFDQQMSAVKAVAGATSEEMSRLEKAAIDLGASTIFSASEVAQAQGELVKAGVSVKDMLSGGLQGALDLAAAGGLELADASTIAAQAMNLFNLEGKEVPRVADVLASGANKSAADVSDLGLALQQAGTVASQTGLSLEETTAALAIFADSGMRGSDAGTSLRSSLQRLTPQSKEAQRVFDELGFSAYDAQGNFIGLEALAGELQESFGHLDTESRNAALGVTFGSDAIRAVTLLMDQGAEGVREYESAMSDSGAAARMAATMTDNLAGDLEELGGAIETGLIQSGSLMNDTLRGMTQGLTGLVDMATEAPRWLQQTALGIGAVVSVGGVGGAGILKLGTSMVSLGDDIASIAGKATGTSKALSGIGGVLTGPWGLAILGATALLGAFAIEQGKARAEAEALRNTLDEQTGAFTEATREHLNLKLADEGWMANYREWGGDIADLTGYINGNAESRARVLEVTERARTSEGYWRREWDSDTNRWNTRAQLADGLINTLDAYSGQLDEQTAQTILLAEANDQAEVSTRNGTVAIRDLALGMADYAVAQQAAVGGADLWLSRSEQMALAGEEAVEALNDWKKEMAGIDAGFVDFSGALAANREATQEWAQAQADSTETADDSWEDFYDGQSVNVDEWISELERMVAAQAEWETNMILLSGRVSQGVLDELARMGPEGAPLVAELVDASDSELARLEAVFGERGAQATGAYATAMYDSGPVIAAAARRWGDDIAADLAERIAAGEITAAEAVEQYDLATEIELGIDDTPFGLGLGAALGEADASTGTPDLDLDPGPYNAELSAALGRADRSTGTPDLDADPAGANRVREAWLRAANAAVGTPDLDARDVPGRNVLRAFIRAVDASDGTVDVYADTKNADSSMRDFFGRHTGKKLSVGITGYMAEADGGIVQRAAGGIDDAGRHVPRQSMMGGPAYGRTNILWGEPETGWEAYISGKPSMRQRNIGILEEAARRLGLTVLDGLPTQAFASGGFAKPMRATLEASLSGTEVWEDTIRKVLTAWARENAVLGHPVSAPVRWRYGWRTMPKWGFPDFHNGVDYAVPVGTAVRAPAAGVAGGGYEQMGGRYVTVKHMSGMESGLFHLSQALVSVGQQITKGQIIARSGNTGTATTGPHVHWQVGRGSMRNHEDPLKYLNRLADGGILDALSRPKVADTGRLTLEPGWNATYNGLGRQEHLREVRYADPRYMAPAAAQAVVADAPAGPVMLSAADMATLARQTAAALSPVFSTALRRHADDLEIRSRK